MRQLLLWSSSAPQCIRILRERRESHSWEITEHRSGVLAIQMLSNLLLMRGNIGEAGFGRAEIWSTRDDLEVAIKKTDAKGSLFFVRTLYSSTDGANRQRQPRMSSQIPTGVWTNRMMTLSQWEQRNIAPITPP